MAYEATASLMVHLLVIDHTGSGAAAAVNLGYGKAVAAVSIE